MQDKFLGMTPPLGWNSWNTFTWNINDQLIRESADAIFAEALHDKKRAGDTIDLVIPHGIGRCSIDRTPLSAFHDLIAEGLGQKGDASAC